MTEPKPTELYTITAPHRRKSRKGIPIASHKGGRTVMVSFRATLEDKVWIMAHLKRNGQSLADWIAEKIKEEQVWGDGT